MKVLKWIGMFLLLWIVGSTLSAAIELAVFAAIGYQISSHLLGFMVLLFITIGLIVYGTRKQK